jgi:transcriptional regulator with XRE-family HTH domain
VGASSPLEAIPAPAVRLQTPTPGAETAGVLAKGGRPVVLLRQEIGDVLRDARRRQGRTLREVSSVARVSLGYLSEVERGQKEASSELLASICGALDVPLASVLHTVSRRVAQVEHIDPQDLDVADVQVPDTVPDGLAPGVNLRDGLVSAA